MRRWPGLILLALLPAMTMAAEAQWPLKQVFGARNVGMVQTSRNAVVEHCPDDTCTRFMLAGANALATLHDFVFLYLALVQNYDIEQIRGPDGTRYFAAVLQRQRGACSGADEAAVARCALARMANRYPVQGFVSRLDEGWRRSEAFDVRAELAKAGIR